MSKMPSFYKSRHVHAHNFKKAKKRTNLSEIMKHPIAVSIVTFFLTGILAVIFSKWIDNTIKVRDLEIANTQRAIDSHKNITDIMYQRAFRADMIRASIARRATNQEINERKRVYDEAFTKYNTELRSNLFRIREMFNREKYTEFENILETSVRNVLKLQDDCITNAYDIAVSAQEQDRRSAPSPELICKIDQKYKIEYKKLYEIILSCEYNYSEAIYQIIRGGKSSNYHLVSMANNIKRMCNYINKSTEIENAVEIKKN